MFSRRSTSRPRGRASTLFFFTLCFLPIFAQKPPAKASGPAYDVNTEVKVKGTVDEVKMVGADPKTKVTRLVLKSGTESNEFSVCPTSFLADMGMSYVKGDELEITGSRVKHGVDQEILVRKIVKGNDTLVLRDEKGKPYWN